MAKRWDDLPPRRALVSLAREFHARGWMPGTAGNLSARVDGDTFWITASGLPKGGLEEGDFLRLTLEGQVVEGDGTLRPSAESAIHAVVYRLFPQARACLHVHSLAAARVSRRQPPDRHELPLPDLEILKGLGIWEASPQVRLALFDNPLAVSHIARAVERRFRLEPPALPALLIRSHGTTVWGESLQQAYDRLECLEFILAYLAEEAR